MRLLIHRKDHVRLALSTRNDRSGERSQESKLGCENSPLHRRLQIQILDLKHALAASERECSRPKRVDSERSAVHNHRSPWVWFDVTAGASIPTLRSIFVWAKDI